MLVTDSDLGSRFGLLLMIWVWYWSDDDDDELMTVVRVDGGCGVDVVRF